jgi:hypothetical protein
MTDIYDLHTKAFQNVSAYVICKNGERVATIAFKFPRDGAGRLYAYVHWLGVPMVRGFAGGCGYDKRSAAVADAVRKIEIIDRSNEVYNLAKQGATLAAQGEAMRAIADREMQKAFLEALRRDDGHYFDRRLQDAGFTVWQAV